MAPPDHPPADFSMLFARERRRLIELLTTLDGSDWSRATPCPRWSVLGLATHLLGDDLSFLARQRDDHHGTDRAPDLPEEGFAAWLDELQARWVEAARRLSPRLVVDLLGWTGPQVEAVLRHQDPNRRTAQVWWAGPAAVPVWLDQGRELAEQWIHRQQLLEALDRPTDLRPDIAGPVHDTLRWAYPFRLGPTRGRGGDRPATDPSETVSIDITGPVARTWLLVSGPSGWDFDAHPHRGHEARPGALHRAGVAAAHQQPPIPRADAARDVGP